MLISRRYKNDGKHYRRLSPIEEQGRQELIKKCLDGTYIFEEYECECGCPFEKLEIISEKDRHGLTTTIRICPICGLVMQNPRLTQKSYNDFYNTVYNKLYRGMQVPTEEYLRLSNKRGLEIAEYIENHYKRITTQRVLDIGTGAGGVLEGIKKECPGVQETGIDLGEDHINQGRARGLNLLQLNSQELCRRGEKFDVIVLSHVFEHMLDLEDELSCIGKMLDEGGVLYIEVPGLLSVSEREKDFFEYFTMTHVRYFSLKTLDNVMRKNGFQMISGDEHIHSLWMYTGTKDCEINNCYAINMNYISMLEKKNRIMIAKKELYRRYKCLTDCIRATLKRQP